MKGITVLGATGSIGVSTLDVVQRHAEMYRVIALTANRDVDGMLRQCEQFNPRFAVMADSDAAERLRAALVNSPCDTEVLAGVDGLIRVSTLPEVHSVMAAIVGAAGLLPTLAAAEAGKRILLANKEALVMSGHIFMDTVHKFGAELLPVDSEHNAVFQCMPMGYKRGLASVGVRRVLLTASGGPFRTMAAADLQQVTPAQACAHPNWDMGRKISVDSATMMNKGLEVIEARWLFDATPDQIEVVVHPQSVIHSLVDYCDGSVLAQLGSPDMRTPIANALAWPQRIDAGVKPLDLIEIAKLDFEAPDMERFPCLALAYTALREGGTATSVLNAANEIAVEAFLAERISFPAIAEVIANTMQTVKASAADDLQQVLAADAQSRACATEYVNSIAR